MTVLVISNDIRSLEFLTLVVRQGDFLPLPARTVAEAIKAHQKTPAKLAVIESTVSLADLLSSCRELRRETAVPIIAITPWVDEFSLLKLYEAGADDCMPWPYSPRILEAKIHVFLRWSGGLPPSMLSTIDDGNICIDPEHHTFKTATGETVRLTPLEFRLLYVLILNAGRVVATEMLIDKVWGYTGEGNRDLLKGLVRRVRSKVEADPGNPKLVVTVPGVGYTFPAEEKEKR